MYRIYSSLSLILVTIHLMVFYHLLYKHRGLNIYVHTAYVIYMQIFEQFNSIRCKRVWW